MRAISSFSTSHSDWHCVHCATRGRGATSIDVEAASDHLAEFPDHELLMMNTTASVIRYTGGNRVLVPQSRADHVPE